MEKLVPNSPQTENWYHVNEEGVYHEGIGLITNPDGVIHQQSILWNGQWTNLTLKANGFAPEQYIMPVLAPEKVLLPITHAYQQLEMKLAWSNVEMQATMDGDQYIVIVEQRYDAPIEDAIFMPEPIIGSRETFIFDVDTGQLSIEAQALLESQTWLFIEKWEYEPVEFVAELPDEPAQLFNSALNDLQTESPIEALLAAMGTKDTPQTNTDIIVSTVLEMAQKQEAALLGKPGWLHIKTQLIIPEGQRGNGYHSATTDEIVPREVLVPDEPIFESWYRVDENGMYQEALSMVTAVDGTIYQQSVLIDSVWINLTLKALDTHPGQYRTPTPIVVVTLPVSEVYQALANSQTRPNVTMQAYLENGHYVVVREERHDPIEDAAFMPEPVIGGREMYYFDPETGQLLFSEVHSILQSETLISGGETTYLTVEFLPEMPAEISKLFDDSMAVAGEEQ